jgi:hypothetical protein
LEIDLMPYLDCPDPIWMEKIEKRKEVWKFGLNCNLLEIQLNHFTVGPKPKLKVNSSRTHRHKIKKPFFSFISQRTS